MVRCVFCQIVGDVRLALHLDSWSNRTLFRMDVWYEWCIFQLLNSPGTFRAYHRVLDSHSGGTAPRRSFERSADRFPRSPSVLAYLRDEGVDLSQGVP